MLQTLEQMGVEPLSPCAAAAEHYGTGGNIQVEPLYPNLLLEDTAAAAVEAEYAALAPVIFERFKVRRVAAIRTPPVTLE